MKIIQILVFVLSCSVSFAGFEIGNGGSVVVCKDNTRNQISVELLDVYEARTRLALNELDFENRYGDLESWINKLKKTEPSRSKLYEFYISTFNIETHFEKAPLYKTNDYGKVPDLLANCDVEQLIIQTIKSHTMGNHIYSSRYIINEFLWGKMSKLNQQAAMLHEIVYRERVSQCVKYQEGECFPNTFRLDSAQVRKFVGDLITHKEIDFKQNSFSKLIKQTEFRRIEKNGIIFLDKVPKENELAISSNYFKLSSVDNHMEAQKIASNNKPYAVSHFFGDEFSFTEYKKNYFLFFSLDRKITLPPDFWIVSDKKIIVVKALLGPLSSVTFEHPRFQKIIYNVTYIELNTSNFSLKVHTKNEIYNFTF